MPLFGLLPSRRHERAGFALYTASVAAARAPAYFEQLGVPDTLDGRFDLVGLFAALMIRRLRQAPPPGAALAQAVFDAMFADMDFNLREIGVGEMSVGKKIRVMWEAFHGRAQAYETPLAQGDLGALAAALWGATCGAGRRRRVRRRRWRARLWRRTGRWPGRTWRRCGAARWRFCPPPWRWANGRAWSAGGARLTDETGAVGPAAAPEMSRLYPVTRIGAGADFTVEAKAEECRALARRMGVEAILSLGCRFDLRRPVGDAVAASGALRARVRQVCVVSLEVFEAEVRENFSLRFVPEGRESDELDLESDDEVTYSGGVLDLGEAAAEQLALALDPFPRKPGAEMADFEGGDEGGAFAGLSRLLPPH